jgi:hypothetical protein
MRRHLLYLAVIVPLTLLANLLDPTEREAPTASGEGFSIQGVTV